MKELSDDVVHRLHRLLDDLDARYPGQRDEITAACVDVLFDRVVNPPRLGVVDAAEQQLVALIRRQAELERSLSR